MPVNRPHPQLIHSCKTIYTEESNHIHIQFFHEGESGQMRVYTLFTGISLGFNDFYMHNIPVTQTVNINNLLINYCEDGRCEVDLGRNSYVFVNNDSLSISTHTAQGAFISPVGRYKGIEFFFDLDQLNKQLPDIFNDLDINPFQMIQNLCLTEKNFITKPPEYIKNILQTIQYNPQSPVSFYRLKTLDLLYQLMFLDKSSATDQNIWLTKGQTLIAKQVYQDITKDLTKKHPVAKLASQYGISETTLRNYFYCVYGKSIPSVIKHKRMEKAQILLSDSEMSITDIAQESGYENQSKFAAAFRKTIGDSPLEYRRKSKIKQQREGET